MTAPSLNVRSVAIFFIALSQFSRLDWFLSPNRTQTNDYFRCIRLTAAMATIPPASSDIEIGSGTVTVVRPASAEPLTKHIPIVTMANVAMFLIEPSEHIQS
jgi:hypothetical protein